MGNEEFISNFSELGIPLEIKFDLAPYNLTAILPVWSKCSGNECRLVWRKGSTLLLNIKSHEAEEIDISWVGNFLFPTEEEFFLLGKYADRYYKMLLSLRSSDRVQMFGS